MFCFCFISHVTTSEIKLKQNCFVSVLFQFYFRCNHCFTAPYKLSYYYYYYYYYYCEQCRRAVKVQREKRPTRGGSRSCGRGIGCAPKARKSMRRKCRGGGCGEGYLLHSGGGPLHKILNFLILKWRIFVDSGEQNSVFTALHRMQTRSSDENSVCPSVCPSVRLTVSPSYARNVTKR